MKRKNYAQKSKTSCKCNMLDNLGSYNRDKANPQNKKYAIY